MAPKKEPKDVTQANKGGKMMKDVVESIAPPSEPIEATSGIGKFYYPTGATYEGEWIILQEEEAELEPEVGGKDVKVVKDTKKGANKDVKGDPKKGGKDANKGEDRAKSPKKGGGAKDEKPEEKSKNDLSNASSLVEVEVRRPNRLRHGKGVYIDGDYRYEGEWKNDKMCGQGIFKYASGASYEGSWDMDKYCGKGEYKWPDGRSYKGDWRENKMHGTGVYVDRFGQTYVGQFFNGVGPGLLCEIK